MNKRYILLLNLFVSCPQYLISSESKDLSHDIQKIFTDLRDNNIELVEEKLAQDEYYVNAIVETRTILTTATENCYWDFALRFLKKYGTLLQNLYSKDIHGMSAYEHTVSRAHQLRFAEDSNEEKIKVKQLLNLKLTLSGFKSAGEL